MSTFDDMIEDVAWGGVSPTQRLRQATLSFGSGVATTIANKSLTQDGTKSVVIAGVRAGVYSIERIGKRPVVVATTPEEQQDLK